MGLIIKNGVIYNGAESEPVVYSLDEREVGVWTDGKPLYQKTFYYSTLSPARYDWALLETLSFSIDTLVKYNVMNQYTEGNKQLGEAYWKISYFNSNNSLYYYTPELGNYIEDVYVTIQYTKTTDTPGSGTWTPSGVKAEHYSTNEHVIGTWIDGSTLYEKTYLYTGTGAANPFSTTIDTTGTRIKKIIPHYASYTYGGGQFGECIGTELTGNVFVAQYSGSVPPNLTVSSYLGSGTETYEICFSIRYIKTT